MQAVLRSQVEAKTSILIIDPSQIIMSPEISGKFQGSLYLRPVKRQWWILRSSERHVLPLFCCTKPFCSTRDWGFLFKWWFGRSASPSQRNA